MDAGRVTNTASAYGSENVSTNEKSNNDMKKTESKVYVSDKAAVYEPEDLTVDNYTKKTYSKDSSMIGKLKAEADRGTMQLRYLVEKLLLKQGHKFTEAENIFSLLREGKIAVDPETARLAQQEISEDGYWGVEQTSERLFSFAKALSGGDPAKAQELKNAVIKGFEQARKVWGGDLPEISQRTYDATMKKFDEWIESGK